MWFCPTGSPQIPMVSLSLTLRRLGKHLDEYPVKSPTLIEKTLLYISHAWNWFKIAAKPFFGRKMKNNSKITRII